MSIYWKNNFVNDYKLFYKNKKVSTIFWKQNIAEIFEQLSDAINCRSEIILSDILPNELPSTTTIYEYEYFVDRFVYCPPHMPSRDEIIQDEINRIDLVIFDNNYMGVFSQSHIKELFLNDIILSRGYDHILFNNNVNSISKLNELIQNVKNVILISENLSLISYVVQCSFAFRFDLNIYPKVTNINRFHGLGLTIENNNDACGTESIRNTLNSLFETSITINSFSKDTLLSLKQITSVESFNLFNEDPYVDYYFNRVYKNMVDDYLWQRTLPLNETITRFERRLIYSYLETTNSPNPQLFHISIISILGKYLTLLSTNYSLCFDEVENEITSLISKYYQDYQSIFDDILENIKSKIFTPENAIYSIIGECFILAYFYKGSNIEKKGIFLEKARLFLSQDIVNDDTKYIHYKSYIELIDSISQKEFILSENDIPFKLIPYLINVNELESIVNAKETPYKDELTWFFKNIIRSHGVYNYHLKNELSELSKNQQLCDFLKKYSNSTYSGFISIMLNNSILDFYNISEISFNSKVICLIYYKKINDLSIDDFILKHIDLNNIDNDKCLMLFSLLSKDFILSQSHISFLTNFNKDNIFKKLKSNNDVFNFCLYQLATYTVHPELNELLRFSESQNPWHFYLQSQFE